MSTFYNVFPFNQAMRSDDARRWHGQDIPPQAKPGRYPTPAEMVRVIEIVTGRTYNAKTDFTSGVQMITAPAGQVTLEYPFRGEKTWTHPLTMRGDFALMLQIVEELSTICGTFLVVADGDFTAIVDKHFPTGSVQRSDARKEPAKVSCIDAVAQLEHAWETGFFHQLERGIFDQRAFLALQETLAALETVPDDGVFPRRFVALVWLIPSFMRQMAAGWPGPDDESAQIAAAADAFETRLMSILGLP